MKYTWAIACYSEQFMFKISPLVKRDWKGGREYTPWGKSLVFVKYRRNSVRTMLLGVCYQVLLIHFKANDKLTYSSQQYKVHCEGQKGLFGFSIEIPHLLQLGDRQS